MDALDDPNYQFSFENAELYYGREIEKNLQVPTKAMLADAINYIVVKTGKYYWPNKMSEPNFVTANKQYSWHEVSKQEFEEKVQNYVKSQNGRTALIRILHAQIGMYFHMPS